MAWNNLATRTTADANASADINTLMENIRILGGNGTTAPSSDIETLVGAITPPGIITPYGGAAAPTGWLLCDGSAVSRTTYDDLFTAISTTFGVGDGSTTFNVPNMQGVFPRGAGSQTINARSKGGGSLGDTNEDQGQGHYHNMYSAGVDTASGAATYHSWNNAAKGTTVTNTGVKEEATDGTNGTPRTGATTEPSSVDVNYIIKY